MAKTKVETVQAVFAAIRADDAARAIPYFHPRLVQHCPSIADGVGGFEPYVAGLRPEQRNLVVVRTIQDGSYLVAQAQAQAPGETMFTVDRFQDELIAEHWVFSAPVAPANQSGHTQIDGPTAAKPLEDTDKNKAFVRRYYEAFHLAGDRSQNDAFFTGEVMIRHEPGVRDGLGEFLHDVEILMQRRTIDEIKLLLGQGDLVFVAAKGTHEGEPCAYIDLYRVEDLKIVEHWGFPQRVPPHAEVKNSNGML